MTDYVNHPDHYTSGDIECIDAIRSALGPVLFFGYLWGTAIAYLWRFPRKNAGEDLDKMDWYIDRIREDGFVDPAKYDPDSGCMIPNAVLSLVNSGISMDDLAEIVRDHAQNA